MSAGDQIGLGAGERSGINGDLTRDRSGITTHDPPALSATGLHKRYGAVVALGGVDLSVARGELVGLLGPNGAGKSTLVKIACGLVGASAGTLRVCGAPAGSRAARGALGYLAEMFRFPGWCTATEVLTLHQRLTRSEGGASERDELLERAGLAEAGGRRVDAMSKGMQQRLGIAQALVGHPKLLLLDEPTSALDPAGRRAIRALLEDLRSRGIAVLLNSHLLSEVELVCDRVVILSRGHVSAAGRPDELTRAGGIEVQTAAGLKRYPDAVREDAPAIVASLVQAGERVYEVRVLRSSLEDVYLEAVGEGATGKAAGVRAAGGADAETDPAPP
ncbi:MAG: ABC transporter ATP-binding protein [Solirubrobacteraceae bacterium]